MSVSGVGSRGCNTALTVILILLLLFLVLMVILPNFFKVPGKSKEAEVKQNLHALQLIEASNEHFVKALGAQRATGHHEGGLVRI